jgi:phosphotriesterase-related protein
MTKKTSTPLFTRREALNLLGAGLAAGVFERSAQAATQFPKGAIIRTVLKDLPPEALANGATLFHEHLSLAPDFMPRWMANYRSLLSSSSAPANSGTGRGTQPAPATPPAPPNQPVQPYFMQDVDLMTAEMTAAAKDGVACIVDGGHPDMGRDLDFLKQVSTKSSLPIVAGCGYYAQPFYPPEIAAWNEDEIARELIRQANTQPVGVFGEIGTWDVMTPDERKVFRAVSKAHLETNLSIFTHTNFGKGALEQLDVFESMGVQPGRVAIGHVGGLNDPKVEVQKAICKRGAFVGFDRQGGPGDAVQVKMVLTLLEAGYANNLLFASDFSVGNQLKRNGGPGYAKTVTVFVPKLREAAVDERILTGILNDNPRRLLAFIPKKSRR